VADALVDGSSVGAVTSYTFTDVQADHTIEASFTLNTYTISASVSGGNGTIDPASQSVDYDGTATIDITPDVGYYIDTITDNDVPQPIANPYVINNIKEDHAVVVTFALGTYNVDATVDGGNGSVDPATQAVDYDGTATIDITPDAHYHIASITDNGTPQTVANPYVINNITEDHTVIVTFEIDTCTVSASVSGGHGSVDPTSQAIGYDGTATIDITPDANYHIASITDNGVPKPVADPFVINNVIVDHDVVVTFAINKYTVIASVNGGNGSVSPATQTVDHGSSVSINITPVDGYLIDSIVDNGVSKPIANPYVVHNINANHDVVVAFSTKATGDFNISATVAGNGGTVTPSAQTVQPGGTVTIDIKPDIGYRIFSVTDNGVLVPVSNPYNLMNIQEEHSVVVTFVEIAFYFAEGYTGDGFQEFLCLGQPGDTPIDVKVTYLFNGEPSIEKTYSVPAHSRLTIDVNVEVGAGKEVSIKCQADYPFVSERPMYFNYTGGGGQWTGGHDAVGASLPANTWYFAEGYTGPGFDEWICILNPGDEEANLTFFFQTQEEGLKKIEGFSVPPNSRRSFKANNLLGGSYQTSLTLESTAPIVAERPMYFSYQGTNAWNWTGGHCVMGTYSISNAYFFAEGTTRTEFEEWVTIQNPNPNPITVEATYQLASGAPIVKEYNIDAARRFTIYVPNEIGKNQDVSIYLSAGQNFLAERPMYFNYQGMGAWGWTGGHCVIGTMVNAYTWFFAEGYTGSGFEEWICIQNPGNEAAQVTITYYPEGGAAPIARQHQVAPNSRYTVPVNADAGPNLAVSARVSSDKPIICERPMYFNFRGVWNGGHDVVGFAQ
jgi:hypothetical protein